MVKVLPLPIWDPKLKMQIEEMHGVLILLGALFFFIFHFFQI
jgi:hypothetical protein